MNQTNIMSVFKYSYLFSSGQVCREMAFVSAAGTTLVAQVLEWWVVTNLGFRILAAIAWKRLTKKAQYIELDELLDYSYAKDLVSNQFNSS